MPKQALLDGNLDDAPDYDGYDELLLLRGALTQNGWAINNITTQTTGYNYIEIVNGPNTFRLHIYLKKVKWRNRSEYEKAAQFPGNHIVTGYNVVQTDVDKTIVLGIYKRNLFNDYLICAWDPYEWGTRGNPFNCFVDVHALANAFLYGFVNDPTKDKKVFAFRPEFIFYVIKNFHSIDINAGLPQIDLADAPIVNAIDQPRNKIIYGAPGTGKSFELRNQAQNVGFIEENIERVTFHPSYSYQQFIGTYKPTPIYKKVTSFGGSLYASNKSTILESPDNKEPLIDYSFIPGPFIKLLIKALQENDQNFLLIIEEINRAPVSSVFGDVFQLLDRNDEGKSEYDISFNSDISNYLDSKGIESKKIKIPSNLFIWATMNSADQGVMPLDAAFKRRWSFEYLPLNDKANVVSTKVVIFQNTRYNWNLFRGALNDKLKTLGISEDKLLGPFFLSERELLNDKAIKNKLLLYLRDDVVRHNPENLFVDKAFSDIMITYDKGHSVFMDFSLPTPEPAEEPVQVNDDGHREVDGPVQLTDSAELNEDLSATINNSPLLINPEDSNTQDEGLNSTESDPALIEE